MFVRCLIRWKFYKDIDDLPMCITMKWYVNVLTSLISYLVVHSKQLEEAGAKRKSRDAKRVYSKVSSNFPKVREDRFCNPKPKKGRDTSSPNKNPTWSKCGEGLLGSVALMENCICCGKSVHKVRDCPNEKGEDKGSSQTQAIRSNDVWKKNHFYPLRSTAEQEAYP